MIRPGDIVIVALAAACIAALAIHVYSGGEAHTLRVAGVHGQTDHPLWQDGVIRVGGPLGDTLIELHNGRARVIESPCAQKLCIRAGWLEDPGEATACVPNRVSAVLLGSDPRFDAVSF